MSKKTTKKAYGLHFYIIQPGEATYTPIGATWENLSQTLRATSINPKWIKVEHYEKPIEVKVLGFYIPKEEKAKKMVFILDRNDYYAIRF